MRRRVVAAVMFVAALASCSPAEPTALSTGPEIIRADVATLPTIPTTTTPPPTTTPPTTTPPPAPATTRSTRAPVAATVAAPAPTVTLPQAAVPEPSASAATSGACHPSYAGTCLPADASDVDCGGGAGNGPVYATAKRFQVVGPDVFDLDRDGDGIACES